MGLINFLKFTISNHSNWIQNRKIDITSIRAILNNDPLRQKNEDFQTKEMQLLDEEETEGSILFEDSDHEEETEIESKLRIYLESFLKDVSSDEDKQQENIEEVINEEIEMNEINNRKSSVNEQEEEYENQNSGAEDAIQLDVNDNDDEKIPLLSNDQEEDNLKQIEEDENTGEEYYLQIKDKLMKNFQEQLSKKSNEKFSIKTIVPDPDMAATAIVEALQDPNKFVKKSILDLFFNELSPEFGLFSVSSATRITFRALLLLENHDYSIQRKLFKYFTSPEVQKLLKIFNQVEYSYNQSHFEKLILSTKDSMKQKALIKLFYLTEGLRKVFNFDETDPLVMRVLHVTRALINENRKLIPILFEFVLSDLLKFLLDLQKWFFLNANASAKKSKKFLIKFLRVLQPSIPNLFFSLSQKATFQDLPPLSLIYKMTELQETSLQTLKSKTEKSNCYENLLDSKFFRLSEASTEEINRSFFQVIFVQLFLKGLYDHQILKVVLNKGDFQVPNKNYNERIIDLLKNEDSLREIFLSMELLDHLLGGFNSKLSLTVINLETLVFATNVIRLLKTILEKASTYSKISFDAEDFVAKTVRCLALLELFVYSGTQVLIRSGVNLRDILQCDPGYKELMGYVEGHKSAFFNPFSQSLLDLKQGNLSSSNIENTHLYMSKLNITAMLGSNIKVPKREKVLSSSPIPSKSTPNEFNLNQIKSDKLSENLNESKKSKDPSIQEDFADRLRNIDSNLVEDNENEILYEGLFESKNISQKKESFKESMFDYINFFIQKHRKETEENSKCESQKLLSNENEQILSLNSKSEKQKSILKESISIGENAFLKNKDKDKNTIISISQSKSNLIRYFLID
jgi:hypothetical protein